jgi:hypothetical protein
VYSVDEVQITGDLVIDEGTLRRLIIVQPEEIFSRKKVEQSVENITAILSNIGYAFANVNPITEVDRDNRLVSVNFFVDPGKRVYIRRIMFVGNSKTKDEVLRREMRQMEGAWFSQAAIDRSRVRMQRLTYFETVTVETPPVPGTDDQVDVIVSVAERPAGSFTVGLGFSQVQGLIGRSSAVSTFPMTILTGPKTASAADSTPATRNSTRVRPTSRPSPAVSGHSGSVSVFRSPKWITCDPVSVSAIRRSTSAHLPALSSMILIIPQSALNSDSFRRRAIPCPIRWISTVTGSFPPTNANLTSSTGASPGAATAETTSSTLHAGRPKH